jgi:lipopolysaccharide transport system permease protein
MAAASSSNRNQKIVTEIRAEQRLLMPDFSEVWRFRDLLLLLGIRDFTVRYRQTLVGLGWLMIQPFAMLLVLAPILSRANDNLTGVPYWMIFLTGFVLWQLFAGTVVTAAMSMVNNQGLLTKVYFPRLLLPLGTLFVAAIEFMISATLLLLVIAVVRGVGWQLALAPVFAIWTLVLALGIGIGLSALNVLYRDVSSVIPFLIQLGFLASPVMYDATLVASSWRSLYNLNPLTATLQGWRWSLLGENPPTLSQIAISLCVTCFILLSGLWYFRKVENVLAEKI